MDFNLIAKIRKQNPLIHNITNIVVANYVANGLLALGLRRLWRTRKKKWQIWLNLAPF